MGNSNIVIREFELNDIETLVKLGKKMHSEGEYSFLPYSKQKCRDLGKKIKLIDNANIWVAEVDGKVIGMYIAIVTEYFFNYEKIAQDYLLYIDKEHRKDIKIPIRLVKKAEAWAREQGAKEFCPGSSMNFSSGKLEKFYNFMKFKTVGHLFKKRL